MPHTQADLRLPVPLTDPAWAKARKGVPPANAGQLFPPQVLTSDEVAALIRACSTRGPSGVRNRALLVVLWRAGLRISEALALFPRDLDLAHGLIRVRRGKGGKFRTAAIDPGGVAVIELWLAERRRLVIPTSKPLFCTIARDGHLHGGEVFRPLKPVYARNLVKRLAKKAGIEKRVHPHGLRHTHAFELAMEGTPVHLIQTQLGHNSLATTGRYLAHVAPAALAAALAQRAWPDEVPGAHRPDPVEQLVAAA
ncbi:MAG TPA: site-specific integrase [Capillimicrobium sp.]|nr:site-specific integrase [Capillimicrobium sp.]